MLHTRIATRRLQLTRIAVPMKGLGQPIVLEPHLALCDLQDRWPRNKLFRVSAGFEYCFSRAQPLRNGDILTGYTRA